MLAEKVKRFLKEHQKKREKAKDVLDDFLFKNRWADYLEGFDIKVNIEDLEKIEIMKKPGGVAAKHGGLWTRWREFESLPGYHVSWK